MLPSKEKIMNRIILQSNKQDWDTPFNFFNSLNKVFYFQLDPCAKQNNKLGTRYFITEKENSLNLEWKYNSFVNPPFKIQKLFVKRAFDMSEKYNTINVCLIPSRVGGSLWHDFIFLNAKVICLMKKRLTFGNAENQSTFYTSLVIFSKFNLNRSQLTLLKEHGFLITP